MRSTQKELFSTTERLQWSWWEVMDNASLLL
jgi:hypothetical protein